jgi:hypothetical protein
MKNKIIQFISENQDNLKAKYPDLQIFYASNPDRIVFVTKNKKFKPKTDLPFEINPDSKEVFKDFRGKEVKL